ncbi:MAG TPA: tetratricopeptide repeat protein [Polyangiaceae bacterium]|nr:tetratricopeptide repeat protein [Polyangiaceae bacterium]
MQRKGRVERVRKEAKAAPQDVTKQLRYVLALLREGEGDEAQRLLAEVEKRDPNNADARFLRAELSQREHPDKAVITLNKMIDSKQDGYAVRLLLAKLLIARGDDLTGDRQIASATLELAMSRGKPLILLPCEPVNPREIDPESVELRHAQAATAVLNSSTRVRQATKAHRWMGF